MPTSQANVIASILVKHTEWDYTDRDFDQIKCTCGKAFLTGLPRTREQAIKAFSEHQGKMIAAKLKL